MKRKYESKLRGLLGIVYITLFVFLLMIGESILTGKILFFSLMSIVIVLIIKSYLKHNNILLFSFIFMGVYANVTKHGLLNDNIISVYSYFNTFYYLYKSSLLLFLFFIALFLFLKIDSPQKNKAYTFVSNSKLFWINILIAILFFSIGKSGETVLEGVYGQTESTHSSLYEYFFIPYVAALIFSSSRSIHKWTLLILAALYVVKSILYGGRIEVVMMLSCLLFWKYHRILSRKMLLFFSFLGIVSMKILEIFRSGVAFSLTSSTTKVILSQEGDVMYASMRLIGMVDNHIFNRIDALVQFIASIVIPSNVTKIELANLASYLSDRYPVGGGGLITAFSYAYGSYIGVFVMGVFIAKLFSNSLISFEAKKNSLFSLYVFFVFISMPRWFAYNPLLLFKFSFLGAIYIYILLKVKKFRL